MSRAGLKEGGQQCIAVRAVFVLAAVFVILLPAWEARAEKKIGVLLYNDEARFTESQRGILDQLKKDGFGEPAATYTIENGRESKARLAEAARKFAVARMDLIITIGTPATLAVFNEVKDVPIVFSMLYDPVEIGIANDWKSSGNNTTGVSPRVPVSKILDAMREIVPIKRLAVLYTPGEKHSELQLKELQNVQAEYQMKVIPVILNSGDEIAGALSIVLPTVDALYLAGSSVVNESIPMIVDLANRAHVATFSHIEEFVNKGVLLSVCANPYRLGRMAGEKAARILRGAKPAAIPIDVDKKFDVILNNKTVKAGKFNIPSDLMKKVTKIVE